MPYCKDCGKAVLSAPVVCGERQNEGVQASGNPMTRYDRIKSELTVKQMAKVIQAGGGLFDEKRTVAAVLLKSGD